MGRLRVFESILLLSVIALLVFPILSICRFLDNNTLVSWRWVFDGVSVLEVMGWILASIMVSALVSAKIPLEKYPVPILSFLAVTVILPLWSEPELLLDSGRYFLQAKHLFEYGISYFIREWGREIPAWTDLPLVPFLYGCIFKIVGEARVSIQFFNTVLFALTLILTAKIGEELWDKETGFYAGMMLLGMHYLMTQVPLMLADIPTMFFFSLAIYLFLVALTKGGGWVPFAGVAIVLAIFTKYSVWLMLLVLPFTTLVINTEDRRGTIIRGGSVLLVSAIVAGLLIGLKHELFYEQLQILMKYQRPALGLWQEGYFSTFFFQISPFISMLACWATYRAYRAGDRHFMIVVFFVAVVFGLQIKRIRYIIPLLPLLALMASYGLQSVKEAQVRRFIGVVIISYSLIVLNLGYMPFFKTTSMMNIMQAGQLLDTLPGDTIEIYTLPQSQSGGNTVLAVPQLDLFTTKKIISRQDWLHTATGRQSAYAPLLFSWKIARPLFYTPLFEEEAIPVLVISDAELSGGNKELASIIGLKELKQKFAEDSGVFRFQTKVYIFDDSCEYDPSNLPDPDVYCYGHPSGGWWPIWARLGPAKVPEV